MELGLHGKTAVIGGSSAGLGLAAAGVLRQEGAHVVICGRNRDRLARAQRALASQGDGDVLALQADLSREKDIQRLADAVLKHYARVDILVNNTGGPPFGGFEDFRREDWSEAVDLLLHSSIAMTQQFLPGMISRKWGRIINITSIAVKQPIPGLMLSNAVRAGVAGWAKTLAGELAAHHITVNNVCPGIFLTERIEGMIRDRQAREDLSREQALRQVIRDVPMNRMGKPEELANTIAFLASEKAGFITGTSLCVDGGMCKGLL